MLKNENIKGEVLDSKKKPASKFLPISKYIQDEKIFVKTPKTNLIVKTEEK